mgnify:CR=1 FL=1
MNPRILLALAACVGLLLVAITWRDGSLPLVQVSRSPASAAADPAPEHVASVAANRAPPDAAPLAAPTADRLHDAADREAQILAASAAAADGLLLPVAGIRREDLHDTFTDARSAGRSHDAIDIMAPAGTPVFAVADGHVEKLFDSARGGLTIYQFEPGGTLAYYYAHLQRYADGLAEGQPLRGGQVIGYVGSTGNASPTAPHLHFAVFVLGPEKRWWEGTAINPYPLLRGAGPAR